MIFPLTKLNDYFGSFNFIKGIFSIWGDFGVGKTTLALQLAINTAKLGKIIFIYSKPNFPYTKLSNILREDSSDILNNIEFISAPDFLALYNIIFNLEFLIINKLKNPKTTLKLIVIDSFTDLYRLELNRDRKDKNFFLNYQLNQLLAILSFINEKYDIEILIVNELSKKNNDDQYEELQSGGKVMDYWIKNSIKISRVKKLNLRNFTITKQSELKSLQILSDLTKSGFK